MKQTRHTQQGMTLLELLVVVGIIGVLVVTSIPNIPPIIANHRISTSGNDLLIKIRSVRRLAMNMRRKLIMEFDVDDRSFQVIRPEHVEYDLLKDIAGAVEQGVDFTSDNQYVLYKEEGGDTVLCMAEWAELQIQDTTSTTCRYAVGRKKGSGIDEMSTDCPIQRITFNPSGVIESTCSVSIKNNLVDRQFTLKVYKGGQVLLRRE